MKKIALMLFSIAMFGVLVVEAQVKSISGTVTSTEDGMVIPGVSVSVKGTTMGTVTNFDGVYTLEVPNDAETLVFSFVGMRTQEKLITGSIIDASMEADMIGVDEVMVVAYGTAKKESFTGSAKVIDQEKMAKRVTSNVTKALEGQVAGVQTTAGSGQPGEGAAVRIRGFGSLNSSNAPLYVVDGVPYDGNLNAISNNDIESITVLKDASAGALYGSRGANGVVIITTKKGKSGDISVELKLSHGFANRAIKPYETMDSKGFIETVYQGFKNEFIYKNGVHPDHAGAQAVEAMYGIHGIFGDNEEYNFYNMSGTDLIDPVTGQVNPAAVSAGEYSWLDEVTNENALRKEYQLLINGGTEKNQVFTSFSYLDEEGLLETTNFERFSGRVGAEMEPKEWLKLGGNVSFAKNTSDYLGSSGSSTSNVWYSAQFMAPIYPVYQRSRDGELILDEQGMKQFDYGVNRPSGAQTGWNSVSTLYKDTYKQDTDNMSGRFHVDLLGNGMGAKLKGLSATTTLGFDYVNDNTAVSYNPNVGNAESVKGRLSKYNYRTFSYTWNQLLRYEREFGNHNISALVGHENYSYKYNTLYGQKTGFPYSGIVELAPGTTTTELSSKEDNYVIESFFSNLQYDFSDRYYLSASFRTDGSSRFSKDKRWGNFWSLGASWRISEEAFMQGVNAVNNLTLKASYGVQGNDNIGSYYAYQSFYALDWPNASLGGALLSSLGNEDIKWEENNNFNVGIEGRFFERVDLTLEYYNRKTVDMLMERPMALSLGFDSYWDNIGEMLNTGIEFTTNVDVVKNNNFEWKASFNLSTLKNEILKLDGEKDQIITGSYIQKEGSEINSFYMATSAGVDPTNGAKLYWAWDNDEDGNPGERYVTDDKNKAVTCKEIQGSRIPDFFGSFGSEFRFLQNFDASFLTTYSVGGEVYDYVYQSLLNPNYLGANYHVNLDRAWKNPGDITDMPRVENGSVFDRTVTDNALIDASYFAIKNISVGYTLPKSVLSRIGMEQVRLYVTFDNLALFSHLDGMNPQYNFSGSTSYVYTPVRTTLFGIDVKF